MDDRDPLRRPIHSQHGETDGGATPACAPKIYVSNEEASVLRRCTPCGAALELRAELAAARNRPASSAELEALRGRRRQLGGARAGVSPQDGHAGASSECSGREIEL
jgi:hypothetical protein